MSSELVSLEQASLMLGVSPERVRQLVISGVLPGVRFGNAWAVPGDAVIARRHCAVRRGRPLSQARAWDEILAGQVDLENVGRFRNRCDAIRCEIGPADVDQIVASGAALRGGVSAAVACGELLSDDGERVDVYVAESTFVNLSALVARVDDPLGNVVLRVVGDASWNEVVRSPRSDGFAPRGAVALDLMESGDPRHWVAAEHLVAAGG